MCLLDPGLHLLCFLHICLCICLLCVQTPRVNQLSSLCLFDLRPPFFYCMWEYNWLPYSTYLYLDFHLFLFVFHDKAKRTQQGNLLVSMLHCSWLYVHVCYCVCEHLVLLGSVCLVDPGPHPLSHRAPPSGEFIRRSVRWTRDWKQFAFSTKRLWWETRYSWATSLDPNVLADIQKQFLTLTNQTGSHRYHSFNDKSKLLRILLKQNTALLSTVRPSVSRRDISTFFNYLMI